MGIVADFVNPVLFSLGSLNVYTYGFFMAMAFMTTHKLMEIEFNRLDIDVDTTHILVAAVVGGIVGAKLHYVLTWNMDALFDINTGLSFQGGLLGGAIVVASYVKYAGEKVSRVADTVACMMPLGHAIGKLGCFFSGDGCYGGVTKMPWGMSFPNGLVPVHKFVHPAPLYEFTAEVVLFAYFWFKRDDRQPRLPFDNFTRVLMAMSISRIVIEPFRDHPVVISLGRLGGINQYQIFSLVAAVIIAVVRLAVLQPLWNKQAKPVKSQAAKKKD